MSAPSITCPICLGEGKTVVLVERQVSQNRFRGEPRLMPCDTCLGSGTITEGRVQAIKRGRDMQRARVERGESIRDAARRMGITAVRLSEMESGIE